MARKKNKRTSRNLIRSYHKLEKTSAIIWFVSGLGVLAFGIYFIEIFELVFGAFALINAISIIRRKSYSTTTIRRVEENKLTFIMVFIGIYSLVNPIGNIPLLFDLYKRDRVLNGGLLDED
ncbi:MAG: hypothetical protein Q4D88_03215 [Anaerococcus sp.]|nr:hypothetical protein [Anaerococcus sp.]